MKTKNFAQFRLFLDGEFLVSGDMLELLDEAQTFAAKNENVKYSIATICFIDSGEMSSIVEGTEILAYRCINGVIYITNQLV